MEDQDSKLAMGAKNHALTMSAGDRPSAIGPSVLRSAFPKDRLTVTYEGGIQNRSNTLETNGHTILDHKGNRIATCARLTVGIGCDANGGWYFEVDNNSV